MDDAEYLFRQDCREKKITAHSANKKVRHTGCRLPSDFMTQREKKALNGEVCIMNIRKPMTYKYFKTLPKDLQQEFLDWIVNTFGVSQKDVCKEMLSVAPPNLHIYIKKVGLKSPFAKNGIANVPYNREAWLKFLAGEDIPELQNAPESCENDLCETNGSSEGTDIPAENDHGEEHLEEATKKLWNDMAEEAKWKLVEQARETLAELEREVASNSLATNNRKLETCGRYGGEKDTSSDAVAEGTRTLDEVVLEQPFEVGSLSFNLKNIKDWDSVVKTLSAFPLPAYNSVTVTVHALKEEGAQ